MKISEFATRYYLPHVLVNTSTGRSTFAIFKNHIEPCFGMLNFQDLSRVMIYDWRNSLIIRGYKPAMINKIQVIFGQMVELAENLQLLSNISRHSLGFKALKVVNRIEVRLSPTEMKNLGDACKKSGNKSLFSIIMLLALTGARKREILDARWEEIDFNRQTLLVPKSKNGCSRKIFLNDGAVNVINSCKLETDISNYVFPNPKTGKPYGCIYHSWDVARKKANLPNLRIHDLRHSFASTLVNQGVSIYDVQHLLGHNSIKTTQRYAHLNDQTLINSAQVAGRFYS